MSGFDRPLSSLTNARLQAAFAIGNDARAVEGDVRQTEGSDYAITAAFGGTKVDEQHLILL